MIGVTVSGSFKNMERFARAIKSQNHFKALDKYGDIGVRALAQATPKDDGETASSWDYEIVRRPGFYAIYWTNSNIVHGNRPFHVAIALQYGHGTRQGGYVQGRDYINPAMRPIFDQMADDMWKVVTNS